MPHNAIINALEIRKHAELRRLWVSEGLGTPPPLRQRFLTALLGYRLQERSHGGLSAASTRRMLEIAGETGRSPNVGCLVETRIRPGTRLQRVWRGELHEVTALEPGFAYKGKAYDSLSVIARLITGTRWSGPAFFGFKNNAHVTASTKRRRN